MPVQDAAWTGSWLAKKLQGHMNVARTELLEPQILQVTRKKHETVVIGSVATTFVVGSTIQPLIDGSFDISFIVNIPKEASWSGEAMDLADSKTVGVGGMEDLFRAMNNPCVREYRRKEYTYFEEVMGQHQNVWHVVRVHDRKYIVNTWDERKVVVVLLNEYELAAEKIRTTRKRYGTFEIVLITNPNGEATTEAKSAARSLGARIFKLRNFMGFLKSKS